MAESESEPGEITNRERQWSLASLRLFFVRVFEHEEMLRIHNEISDLLGDPQTHYFSTVSSAHSRTRHNRAKRYEWRLDDVTSFFEENLEGVLGESWSRDAEFYAPRIEDFVIRGYNTDDLPYYTLTLGVTLSSEGFDDPDISGEEGNRLSGHIRRLTNYMKHFLDSFHEADHGTPDYPYRPAHIVDLTIDMPDPPYMDVRQKIASIRGPDVDLAQRVSVADELSNTSPFNIFRSRGELLSCIPSTQGLTFLGHTTRSGIKPYHRPFVLKITSRPEGQSEEDSTSTDVSVNPFSFPVNPGHLASGGVYLIGPLAFSEWLDIAWRRIDEIEEETKAVRALTEGANSDDLRELLIDILNPSGVSIGNLRIDLGLVNRLFGPHINHLRNHQDRETAEIPLPTRDSLQYDSGPNKKYLDYLASATDEERRRIEETTRKLDDDISRASSYISTISSTELNSSIRWLTRGLFLLQFILLAVTVMLLLKGP